MLSQLTERVLFPCILKIIDGCFGIYFINILPICEKNRERAFKWLEILKEVHNSRTSFADIKDSSYQSKKVYKKTQMVVYKSKRHNLAPQDSVPV